MVTPGWSGCNSWFSAILLCSHKKQTNKPLCFVLFCFHSFNLLHLYWCWLIMYTGQLASDLCFWIYCLSSVLVPQGNSFILTQLYNPNRKITGSEIIIILRETGPLVFWVIVSPLADWAGRKDGLKWSRPLSSQVSAKAVSRKSKQEANQHTVSKMCMNTFSEAYCWYMGMSPF